MIKYLNIGEIPNQKWKVMKVKNRVAHFIVKDGVMYRQDFSIPHLRCVPLEEAEYILAEIHKGVYENHSIKKALAIKVVRASYNWLHALKDVEEFIRK